MSVRNETSLHVKERESWWMNQGGNRNNWKTEVWEGARLRQGGAAVGKKNRGERVLVKKDYRTVCYYKRGTIYCDAVLRLPITTLDL